MQPPLTIEGSPLVGAIDASSPAERGTSAIFCITSGLVLHMDETYRLWAIKQQG
jgi:hypothetical protein